MNECITSRVSKAVKRTTWTEKTRRAKEANSHSSTIYKHRLPPLLHDTSPLRGGDGRGLTYMPVGWDPPGKHQKYVAKQPLTHRPRHLVARFYAANNKQWKNSKWTKFQQ